MKAVWQGQHYCQEIRACGENDLLLGQILKKE